MKATMKERDALTALGFTRAKIQRTEKEATQAGMLVSALVRESVSEMGYQFAIVATPLKRNSRARREG
jgi:Holliday junction resolvasome RuvABC DNA-binding subunit